MAFVLLQEILACTSWQALTWLTPGGDWRANRMGIRKSRPSPWLTLLRGHSAALLGAWFAYYMPERLWQARQDYLRSRS